MIDKKSYLFIPHAPATRLKTRADELAAGLAGLGHRVELVRRAGPNPERTPGAKLRWHLGELLRGVRVEEAANFARIYPPTLHHATPAQRVFDRYLASYLLQRRPHDVTISSAFGGPSFPAVGARRTLVYDYVDDHASGWRHAGQHAFARRVERFMAREVGAAHRVLASSLVQVEEVRRRYGRAAEYVPNGANVGAIRAHADAMSSRAHADAAPGHAPAAAGPLRVLYMGGLDYFVNLDWPLAALERLRLHARRPVELWIAGEGPALRGRSLPEWVRPLGFRPAAEMPALLAQVQVGIVPFALNPFTDAALPLKVLEYGAARLRTVSSPLAELREQRLPWVRFAEAGADAWYAAFARVAEEVAAEPWPAGWDAVVDEFDWSRIAARLDSALALPEGHA